MSKKMIGIDLGGTSIKFAIVTESGMVEKQWNIPTDISDEGSHIVPDMIASLQKEVTKEEWREIIGIGMGSPGGVDCANGTVTGAYNLNWVETQDLKTPMEETFHVPFYVDNDANVAALGEQWQGAGENQADVVLVTLGTGVGGGIVLNHQLMHGIAGGAGEIGHVTVALEKHDFPCTCGKKGCLETIASATGIVNVAKKTLEESTMDSILRQKEEFSAKDVYDAAKMEDALALSIVDQVHQYLGLAVANIANTLNPACVVIGGGVSAAGEILRAGVQRYFEQFTFPLVQQTTKIRLATLGNDAGVIGAASLVLQA